MTKKSFSRAVLLALIFAIFLTSSFDIALTYEFFGFTFRMTQALSVIFMIVSGVQIIRRKKGRFRSPLGAKYLIAWLALLLLFTFHTSFPKVNFAYDAWAIFNVVLVFAFANLNADKNFLKDVLKLYIISFVVLALFGILEFVLGVNGVKFPYIAQWWAVGYLPRPNGLSFEPSYYATYLLMGWSFCRYLAYKKAELFKHSWALASIIALAIILSSSRLSLIAICAFELILDLISIIRKRSLFPYVIHFAVVATCAFGIPTITSYTFIPVVEGQDPTAIIMEGTGIGDSNAHSSSERLDAMLDTLQVFIKSPIIGRGFGGTFVSIAENRGLDPSQISLQDEAGSMNIASEMLAATGIFGSLIFLAYLLVNIFSYRRLESAYNISKSDLAILKALLFAFFVGLVMLQFNQNILRPFVWTHIALIAFCFETLKLHTPLKKNPTIAVDARMYKMSGIGTYLKNLNQNGCYDIALGYEEQFDEITNDTPSKEIKLIPYKAGIYGIKEQLFFPRFKLWLKNPALLHVPHYNVPLFYHGRMVVTIHDLTHITHPEFLPSKFAYLYAKFMFFMAIHKSEKVITVSENTKKDILKYYRVKPEKIVVIPNGVSDNFKKLEQKAPKSHNKVLLYVGNLKQHKNLNNLLKAFAKLDNKNKLELRLVGKSFDSLDLKKTIKELKIEKYVKVLGEKSASELVEIYNSADLFVFPSFYEGFGLPILESLRCGTPVICSNTSSMPEVGGKIAAYFDPADPDDIARAISENIDEKSHFDYKKALKWCNKFSWEQAAKDTKACLVESLE